MGESLNTYGNITADNTVDPGSDALWADFDAAEANAKARQLVAV